MPADPVSAARAARFGRHWDELALGWPAEFGADDADLAEAVRRLHAADDTPGPDPAFAARLLAELQPGAPVVRLVAPPRPVPSRRPAVPAPPPARRSGSLAAVAATVLLLLGTLLAGLVTGSQGPGRTSGGPQLIPETSRHLPPGLLSQEILVQQRWNDLPAGPATLQILRATLQPGATWTVGGNDSGSPGPVVFRVEQNLATLTTGGPAQVTRAAAPGPAPQAANSPLQVAVGDTVAVPSGAVARWTNATSHPTTLLVVRVGASIPPAAAGVSVTTVAEGPLTGRVRAPADLLLRRVVLAADGSLPGQATGGAKLVAVEQGTVAVDLAAPAAPETTVDVRMVAAGGAVDVNDGETFASAIHNLGPTAATVLVATLTPAFVPSPLSSPPAAVSAQASSDVALISARVAGVPADAHYAQLDRATLSPGSAWAIGSENGIVAPLGGQGVWAWLVESGELTVSSDGPVAVTMSMAQSPSDQTGTFALHPGDQASVLVGPPFTLRNNGANPVTLLVASLSRHARTELPEGVAVTPLVLHAVATPPSGPVALSVQRTVFRDGGHFAGPEPVNTVVLYAESGAFGLTWGTPPDLAQIGWVRSTPAQLSESEWVDASDPANPVRQISNPGPGKAALLRFSVVAAAPAAPPPAPVERVSADGSPPPVGESPGR